MDDDYQGENHDDDRDETMSWIDDEEMEDEFYGAFYNSPIESVQLVQMLFSHDCQKCVSVSRAAYQLNQPGILTPEELIPMMRCQTTNGFQPFAVLRFAIELDSANLDDFVSSSTTTDGSYKHANSLEEVMYTDNISFPDSVKALEPTATLFVLYKKKQPTPSSTSSNKKRRKTRVARNTAEPTSIPIRKTRRVTIRV